MLFILYAAVATTSAAQSLLDPAQHSAVEHSVAAPDVIRLL